MSSLSHREKRKLEQLFEMSGGYVLDFNDRTFGDFFTDLDVDIHSEKYRSNGTSKANKLRTFWEIESDQLVGNAVAALIELAQETTSEDNSIRWTGALWISANGAETMNEEQSGKRSF